MIPNICLFILDNNWALRQWRAVEKTGQEVKLLSEAVYIASRGTSENDLVALPQMDKTLLQTIHTSQKPEAD